VDTASSCTLCTGRVCTGAGPRAVYAATWNNLTLEHAAIGEGVLASVLGSEEFFPSRKHDLPRTAPCTASTAARMILSANSFHAPKWLSIWAERSSDDPKSALFALGYPHAPETAIVDRPAGTNASFGREGPHHRL